MNLDALRQPLEDLHEASFAWARACCRHEDELAADVLQTAYLKVLGGRAVFRGESSFKTWFFGVIRLTALEENRRRWTARLLSLRWLDERETDSMESGGPAHCRERWLLDALERLPARQRQVLHLVVYQKFSLADAAVSLGISIGSTRTHYERAKQRLKAAWKEQNDETERPARLAQLPAATRRIVPAPQL